MYQRVKHNFIADGYIKEVYVSLINGYIKIPIITRIYCDVCNYDKEGE